MNFYPKILACAIMAATSLAAQEIRIAASDLLADFIDAPLQQYAVDRDLTIDMDAIGSLPALDQLRANEIDLAVIAIPEGDEVPRQEFSVYPFAYDVAVVVANENNPINEISLSQLGGIFGSEEELSLNSWGDLGLSGWGNRRIKPISGTAKNSIALELFKYVALERGTMKSGITMVNDSEIEGFLDSDAASIGILSRMPTSENLNVLMVSPDSTSPAFGPTVDNVHFGDYPIRLPFYFVFKPRDAARLQPILRELFGDVVTASLRENHLLPLPDTVRRKFLIDLDLVN